MKAIQAKYIFDNTQLLEDYTVITKDNIIIDIDKTKIIKKTYQIPIDDLGEGIIFAGFVNLHTHLELSHLIGRLPQKQGFVEWLKSIISIKKQEISEETVKKGIQHAVQESLSSGVRAVADISNTLISFSYLKNYMPLSILFYENYALNRQRACSLKKELEANLERLTNECSPLQLIATPHSIYSTNGCLLDYLFNINNKPRSIHFLESSYEKEFLQSKGELFEMLDGFGLIDEKMDYEDIFDYLKTHNALKENTIFVHCVDADKGDIETIKQINSTVCLCPRSNYYISRRMPDVYMIEKSGVNVGIGTDSLSSNYDLNFLNELSFLYKHFSHLSPKTIFKWATKGGADALNINLGLKKNSISYNVFFKTNTNSPLEEILEKGGKSRPNINA
jgi:cytosine/adenosine deaminase-related metal-dependent hydrolase